MCQHLSVARIAEALAVSWDTANDAVLAEGRRVLVNDPARLDGVWVIGVDEHCWRHTRRGDKFVTVIIDLTPVRDGVGPARLLDMVPGRSKQVFTAWLHAQPVAFRDAIEVVAMDGFAGFKTATAEQLPDATAVMDPFHVVGLAGDALDRCGQRVQQNTCGHRGRTGDPLYGIRHVLRTGADLLTDKQRRRLSAVFADERHVEVQATWGVYQRLVAAYRHRDRAAAKIQLRKTIDSISTAVPKALTELITLGRTLKRRTADVLAYFDRPGTSNGPTEAINGRLEHLRGTPLGFRNLTNYIARALLEPAASDPNYTLESDEPLSLRGPVRLWIEDLAREAGHELDWTRSSPERNVHVAAANGDYEPMRALLTVAAGGTVGVDREVAALYDLDKLQHGQAWARTGAVFGTDEQKQTIAGQLKELGERIGIVQLHLEIHDQRATTTAQPAVDRWRGLAASINPAMTHSEDWPQYANALDTAAADGIDVATELPSMLAARTAEPAAITPDAGSPTSHTVRPHPDPPAPRPLSQLPPHRLERRRWPQRPGTHHPTPGTRAGPVAQTRPGPPPSASIRRLTSGWRLNSRATKPTRRGCPPARTCSAPASCGPIPTSAA